MGCREWSDEWVGRLYGELDAAAERDLAAHLRRCADCRRTIERLEQSRGLLREAALPAPAAPRILVLGRRPRAAWPGAWSFAAGAACALLLFGAGFLAGPRWSARETAPASGGGASPATITALPTSAEPTAEIVERLALLDARLSRCESATQSAADRPTAAAYREALEQFERRVNRERARDLEYVMRSLTASELRTGTWMDQTQEALTLLALKQDPRFGER